MEVTPLVGTAALSCRYCTARWNIFDGSVRSGKTVGSLLKWLEFVRNGPAGPLLMFGRTERTLRRNVIDTLVEMLGVARCRLVAGSGELWLLGRKVYIVGANDQTAQEKIRGLTLAGAYGDELSTIPESFMAMLGTRMSIPGAQVFGTTNPDGPRHWLKVNYLDRAALTIRDGQVVSDRRAELELAENDDNANVIDLHRFRFRLTDNHRLDPDYLRALTAEYVGLWRKRYIDGEWSLASGVVYDMFDETRHVVDELPELVALLATGIDYGATNPTVALMVALDKQDRLVVTREYRHDPQRAMKALTVAELSGELSTWLMGQEPRMQAVDPAAKVLKDQLRADGFKRIVDANNSVLDGIRLVASLLATDRLVIHSSCKGLLDELPGYAWDDQAAERGEDKPVKVNDHAVDALRYALATSQHWWNRDPIKISRPARRVPVASARHLRR